MEVKEQLHFKDIISTLCQMPKTLKLVFTMEKKLFIKIVILSLITGLIPIVSLYVSQELINSLVRIQTELKTVLIIFCIYIAVSFFSDIISQISEYYNTKFQFSMNYKLNYIIMEKSSKLSLEDFENPEVYDKLERITREVAYKPYQIFQAAITMITATVTLISALTFLMVWNPTMSMLMLLVPVISLFYFLKIGQQEFFMQWKRTGEERRSWYLNYILTHDFSFKEVKLYRLKDYILEGYWTIKKKFMAQDTYILRKKTTFNLIYEVMVQLVGAVVIVVAILAAYTGKIMVGNVLSYIRSVGLVQSNSQSIINNIYSIYNSNLYMNQLFEFLEYREEHTNDDQTTERLEQAIYAVDIQDVSFQYPSSEQWSLQHVQLSFRAGERVAIVGPNGSGKSTLIKLLAGLYQIQEGDIKLNDTSIKKLNQESYMQQMAVLFQDYMKYEMTLQENIGFGQITKMDQTDQIKKSLHNVRADFLKNQSDYDLDMQLGLWFDEGRQLSGGQWQKVALARTYFREASLYILDEPSAALDPIAEKETFDTFFKLSREKIGIFISHRLIAAQQADRIIVMDQGKVVGQGKHNELMQNCPIYKHMYESENYEIDTRGEAEWKEAL